MIADRIADVPSDEAILEYVSALAGDGGFQAQMYVAPHRKETWRSITNALSLILPFVDDVLEAGCAEGIMSKWIAPRVELLVGVDFLEVGIQACRDLKLDNARFVLMNLRDLTPQFDQFDLVLACDVLEHLPDPVAFMEAARIMAPGILATVPINEGPNPRAFNFEAHANPKTPGDGSSHIWSFREDTFRAMFEEVWHYEDNGVTALIVGR